MTDGLPEAVLDRAAPYKPLDAGNGRVAASVAADGTLLALTGPHPALGVVTLGGAAPFADRRRHDPGAVRAYRAGLAAPGAAGFGLAPPDGWEVSSVAVAGDVVPRARLRRGPVEGSVTTWAPPGRGEEATGVVQRWSVRGAGATTGLAWRGRLGLGRPALTQLTEGGILPAVPGTVEVAFSAGTLTLRAPGVAAAVTGLPPSEPSRRAGPGPLEVHVPWEGTDTGTSQPREATVAWALGRDPDEAARRARSLRALATGDRLAADAARWRDLGDGVAAGVPDGLSRLVRRGVVYALACCAWPVGDSVCLVTDHQILPLSWTRDAYYVTQALLARPGPRARDVVGRHLRWLFEVAARPEETWGRAYLPDGTLKDRAFQLDQQCYPLLELADYVEACADATAAAAFAGEVRDVLDAIGRRRAEGTELVATQETPGDDPIPLPYHFSSHVVLWWTLRRLAVHAGPLGLDAGALEDRAGRLRREVRRQFTVTRAGRRMFAYAVDRSGGAACLHDANDLPTVLAPLWGLCTTRDPVWRETVRFAFSPENAAGWFPGRFGGLGSPHTPAPWPLGDVQELVAGRLLGEARRVAAATARLRASACWDGALPEARDPQTGAVRSRHWFAWPGAALAAALTHPRWEPRGAGA